MSEPERPLPGQVCPPAEYLRDELAARGWDAAVLARRMDYPLAIVRQLLSGEQHITPSTAARIGDATGTHPDTWLALDALWRRWLSAARATAPHTPDERTDHRP